MTSSKTPKRELTGLKRRGEHSPSKKKAEAKTSVKAPCTACLIKSAEGANRGQERACANARTHLPLKKQGETRGTTREKRRKNPPA